MSYSVSEILEKAKKIIENNREIGGYIQITGEVGTFKVYGKHAYLNLKEANAVLKCVYFMVPTSIVSTVEEGSVVEAYGHLSIYEPRGEFQFYVKSMREISKAGILMLEYERIKQQLISEKIIPKPPEERKNLPDFPNFIGVITSRNGAAFQDIIKTIGGRYPECTIHLFHSGVQGSVESQIVETIKKADHSKADLLLLARGGGSIEDLWCFNHPNVVKAVRTCKKPIVVGVGHETDHTLCEYAADHIGSTPTAAAMLATPDLKNFIETKKSELEKITLLVHRKSSQRQSLLNHTMKMIHHLDPGKVISTSLRDISTHFERISTIIHKQLNEKKHDLDFLHRILQNPSASLKYRELKNQLLVNIEKINSNDPNRYLQKGFTRIEKDGMAVNSVVQLNTGDLIDIFLKDGKARSEIVELIKDE